MNMKIIYFCFFFIIFKIKSDNIETEINFENKYNEEVENIKNDIKLEKNDNLNDNNNIHKNNLKKNEDIINNEKENNTDFNDIIEINENNNKLDIKNLNIIQKVVTNDKLSKILRLFLSLGFILDPTVKIYKEKINEEIGDDFEINILSGFRFAIDYIPTNVINKYIGLTRKYRIFGVKLKDSEFFVAEGLKNDYNNYIFGIQGEIGISLPLNIRYNKLIFNNNNINKNIHSINILGGLKFEIGDIEDISQNIKNLYPTKLVFELIYILDLEKWFSFYISSSFYQCFSPVYLLSFNLNDFKKCLNTSNKFQWNLDITIGLIGLNFPI